jgi:hypothetical protein
MAVNFNSIDNSKRTKCEIWTRAMGYCRPVSNFNKGKKSEFYERKFFTEERLMNGMESSACHSQAAVA